MTIPYFSGDQMNVFIPAMIAALVATIAICMPVIFATALSRSAARIPVLVVCALVGLAGIAGTVVLAVPGFHTLSAQTPALQRQIEHRYGLKITADESGKLIDGNKLVLPETGSKKEYALRGVTGGTYILTTGGLEGELPPVS